MQTPLPKHQSRFEWLVSKAATFQTKQRNWAVSLKQQKEINCEKVGVGFSGSSCLAVMFLLAEGMRLQKHLDDSEHLLSSVQIFR